MTPAFWIAIALLVIAAAVFIILPLFRSRPAPPAQWRSEALEQRKQRNIELYQQRQDELQQEADEGMVSPEELERLQTEAKRAFLRDMEALEQQGRRDEGAIADARADGRVLPLACLLLVPVLSIGLYLNWGAHQDLVLPQLIEQIGQAEDAESQRTLLVELTVALESRFEREPDDMRNGYMLGTLYQQLEEYDKAAATFRRMLGHMEDGPDKATVSGQLARSLFLANGMAMSPEVEGAMQQTLELNPNQYDVMEIMASVALEQENLVEALGYFRRQLAAATPGSRRAERVRQVIGVVESYLTDEERAVADGATDAGSGTSITVTVDVAAEFADRLDAMQSLFVYVRNPDVRPPLLAQNIAVPDFPVTLTLDNSMSMTGMTLDSAPTLIVGARLSTTGNAIAASGDIQTVSEPFTLEALDGPVQLTIDEPVP